MKTVLTTRCERISRCHSLAFTPIELLAVIAIMTAVFLFTGCRKKESSTPPPTVSSQTEQPAATQTNEIEQVQMVQMSPPVMIMDTNTLLKPERPLDLSAMTTLLHIWVRDHGRKPNSFEEFASTCGYQIPPPESGKKYVINYTYHVVMADK